MALNNNVFINGCAGKAGGLVENNRQVFIKIKSGRAVLVRRAFTRAIYH